MRISLLPVLLCLPLITPAVAEESPSVNIKRLTLNTAGKAAHAAIEACRAKGVQVGVTLVDRNGLVQVSLRDTLAASITIPISQGKARAAANFGVPTSALKERANGPIGRTPGLVMSTGGLPIEAAGTLYGAIGVSGAPSGLTDEECAQAGVDAIQDDLEMAM
ncbi:MAG: heme-binding protein [Gammaproteobacteria bacterium SHHR-1]|uniref:GlcG/HbpS family heme-binding protein n=1 Tax=Magnetovirga frankeli TaxID=947516 RepID=UPI00129314D7|nr:heme-binding protein [gamma proteobacterium SS-5]